MPSVIAEVERPAVPVAGSADTFPVRRVYCVGRNYAAHAREMGHDPDREDPFFFMKPAGAIVPTGSEVPYPPQTKDYQHEIELVVALAKGGANIPEDKALDCVFGYAVGLDMTRRDLQAVAKKMQRPWDLSKGFDESAPCSAFQASQACARKSTKSSACTRRTGSSPNSWGGTMGGPREAPDRGFRSFPAEEGGPKLRVRAELFADHYSQARQFYLSQTPTEKTHIKDAFVFELSKVETPTIRARMGSHLLNVDEELARKVADGLGLQELPKPAEPARPVLENLPPSPALSIIRNGPNSFKGRKLGVLATDGTDAGLLAALKEAVEAEGAMIELVAPKVGGITASDGTAMPAKQKINGGPSVLYDAIAVIPSAQGAALLANEVHICVVVLSQAAAALRDKELASACEQIGGQNGRQISWCLTRIKQAAPQSLVVAA